MADEAALLAGVSVPMAAIDSTGTVIAWTAGAERLFGVAAESTLGQRVADLEAMSRIAGLPAAIEAAQRGEPADPLGDRVIGEVTVTVTATPVTGGRVVVTATDVTALRAAERRLQRLEADMRVRDAEAETAAEELRAANEHLQARLLELRDAQEAASHKDDFLALLAHELRNPLAPIVSAVRVIGRHLDNPEVVRRALDVVDRQVHHQARLLDDLLDASRITRGRIELRRAPLELAAVVGSAVETARPMIEARRHSLSVTVSRDPIRLQADATRLAQVVAILLDNAAKYTPPGGQISVDVERHGKNGVIRVRDTGVGIPPDMQRRVFDLFTQVDPPIARSLGGLGIGLSLARSLVALHGGEIRVASDGPGQGTEFTVQLPLGDAESTGALSGPARAPRRRVLVVEDNADAREMLRMSLELDGHQVDVAEDGLRGVEAGLARRPDIVIVDLGLPGLDGYGVARQLRAALGERVRLVALTGYGQAEDRRRTREAGFDAHLVKPVDPETLARVLGSSFTTAA